LEVILTKDFEKLGSIGDIVNVKSGYAKNYLIPNEIAIEATPGNKRQMEIVKKAVIKKEAKNVEEAEKVAEKLKDLKVVFTVKTSEEGKLYGSITNKDISEKIFDERKVELDKKKIELDDHIKELGEFDINIRLYKEVKSIVKVLVESDEPEKLKIDKEEPEQENKKKDGDKVEDKVEDKEEEKEEEKEDPKKATENKS